jgi:hypothetical protein
MRSWALPILIALAGCASTPSGWTRLDGSSVVPQRFTADETACRGEMSKANLSSTRKALIEEILSPRQQDLNQIYVGCMVERGYSPASSR